MLKVPPLVLILVATCAVLGGCNSPVREIKVVVSTQWVNSIPPNKQVGLNIDAKNFDNALYSSEVGVQKGNELIIGGKYRKDIWLVVGEVIDTEGEVLYREGQSGGKLEPTYFANTTSNGTQSLMMYFKKR